MPTLGNIDQTNWNVDQGADWQFGVTWTQSKLAVDLTGARVDLWLKRDVTDDDNTAIKLSTDAGGHISVPAPTTGRFLVDVPGAVTATWNGLYVYDAKITLVSGFIKRIIQGQVSLDPEVTV